MNPFYYLNSPKAIALFFISFFLSLNGYGIDLYVARTGNDKNPGSKTRPFATIAKAQLAARKIKGPVTILVREGIYYLDKPVIFTAEDSRPAGAPVTYKPYPGEKVVISGGAALNLRWETYEGDIKKAVIANDIQFDQLYINNEQQRMARYPNYHPASSHFGGYAEDLFSEVHTKQWKNPEGAYIHALHKHEWGGYHYIVKGKDAQGKLEMEGGFQNNRQMGMHDKYRFIENVREELDTAGEWYFDKKTKTLYAWPSAKTDLEKASVLSPQLKHLFEFRGSSDKPVRHISLEGFEFAHVRRTFMETKEPLLRSDWAIYRGGAVVLEGTENCAIRKCYFNQVGGNAVFFSNYNRKDEVSGNTIAHAGASGVCFVGDPGAVRSPSFEYNQFVALDKIDKTPGPKTSNYPAECTVSDNLMFGLGQVEKQVAGVEISMAMDITVSHNTIYNVPRSGINISEGTWGGHIIEFNEVFNTVLETGDHGSFNSWGRDRYWHPDREKMDRITSEHPELVLLDAQKTIIIRNNRFRCDHGWDIDLDDGSSNYHIYNNVCLNGGLKLREGFKRIVENNIIINNSFHPHVWFKESEDVFRKNIVLKPYYPIGITTWGKEVDYNFFPSEKAIEAARKNGTDKHSMYGDPLFMDPANGDFRVKPESPALKTGFKNFPMDQFGVMSGDLKNRAAKVPLPITMIESEKEAVTAISWLGSKLRNVQGLGDRSAYGLPDEKGVIIENIPATSILSKSALKVSDVIRTMNNKPVNSITDLIDIYQEINWTGKSAIEVMRNQQLIKTNIDLK
ncbi:hypothetical protein DYBT9275_01130 [Dyadobacter sp. CECT 9275]|uniref:Peptide-binding protein n=1 Tax=Dyadobacter helix TaxID=2822344 RepID=A0A916J9Y4_9BACT|nr:PDZ domain-containing protein [Dyadobacter sp. CECT 9275]CAG4993234.1 hypothetical protein DYBT9275_01130 [Dyadobacter sp. CECT 9275]